jgi:hypothetical protein
MEKALLPPAAFLPTGKAAKLNFSLASPRQGHSQAQRECPQVPHGVLGKIQRDLTGFQKSLALRGMEAAGGFLRGTCVASSCIEKPDLGCLEFFSRQEESGLPDIVWNSLTYGPWKAKQLFV